MSVDVKDVSAQKTIELSPKAEALRERLRKKQQALNSPPPDPASSADEQAALAEEALTEAAAPSGGTGNSGTNALHKRVEGVVGEKAQPTARQRIDARRLQEQEIRSERLRQRSVRERGRVIVENAKDAINPAIDRASRLSTVGGVGLLLVVLLLLLFTLVQVDAQGNTRMKQLWYMLNGRAHLQGAVIPQGQVSISSADFAYTPGKTVEGSTGSTGSSAAGTVANPLQVSVNGSYRTITGSTFTI